MLINDDLSDLLLETVINIYLNQIIKLYLLNICHIISGY